MNLPRIIVAWRRWIAAGWIVAAFVLAPEARHVASLLETAARVDGSESAEVARLLAGPLASRYARVAVLVVRGAPPPGIPAGNAVLQEVVDSLRAAPEVSGTISWLDGCDSVFLANDGSGTFVGVGLRSDGLTPEQIIPPLRARTASRA